MLDLRDEMRKQGVECDESIVVDGEIHRFHIPGDKRARRNGWYVFNRDGDKTYGAFGDWKSGLRGTIGGAKARQVIRQIMDDRKEKDAARAERAALRARMEWDAGIEPVPSACHDYLGRKGIRAYGLRLSRDALLVPMMRDGEIIGLQKIFPDGQKRFTPGCKKLGASFLIGTFESAPALVVAEGYATAASIFMGTSLPVLVAFDCGNLLPATAGFLKSRNARLIWAADNDAKTEGNPGLTKATLAAKQLGGTVTAPAIAGDFNDLHASAGLGAVAEQIYSCL